jgi:hypothetical protein
LLLASEVVELLVTSSCVLFHSLKVSKQIWDQGGLTEGEGSGQLTSLY